MDLLATNNHANEDTRHLYPLSGDETREISAFDRLRAGQPGAHSPTEEKPMTTSQQHDVVDDIIADHREVEEVFKQIEQSDDTAHRRDLVEHVIAELVRHSVGEEQYVYPTARRVLDDGDKVADHELEEHAEAEKVMKQIEKADADDQQFDELVDKLMKDVATTSRTRRATCCPSFARRARKPICVISGRSSRKPRRWRRLGRTPRRRTAHRRTKSSVQELVSSTACVMLWPDVTPDGFQGIFGELGMCRSR